MIPERSRGGGKSDREEFCERVSKNRVFDLCRVELRSCRHIAKKRTRGVPGWGGDGAVTRGEFIAQGVMDLMSTLFKSARLADRDPISRVSLERQYLLIYRPRLGDISDDSFGALKNAWQFRSHFRFSSASDDEASVCSK